MQKFCSCTNPQFHQLSEWLVSDDPTGEEAGCGGPGLAWLNVVCGCDANWRTAKFSKTTLETAYGREINIKFSGNSSSGQTWSQHANCMLPHAIETSVALCCVTKLQILEWPFIDPRTKCTWVMIMLFNQLVDMPLLSGRWIILANEKCSLTGMCPKWERNKLMKHGTNMLHVAFIFLLSIFAMILVFDPRSVSHKVIQSLSLSPQTEKQKQQRNS